MTDHTDTPTEKKLGKALTKYYYGDSLSDLELDWLINHYESLMNILRIQVDNHPRGGAYIFQLQDARHCYNQLVGFKQSRARG